MDWVTAFVRLCGSLKSYIKQFHPRGLKWNPSGVSPEQAFEEAKAESTTGDGSKAPPSAPAGGAPPPPPPPMPSQLDLQPPSTQTTSSGASDSMGAVFQDLNRGEAVTSGLRKVEKGQMTHKNPALRAQEPAAPARSDSSGSNRGKSPAPNRKPDSMRTKKPPRKQLDGNKWTVEHYENGTSPIEIDAEKQHSILVSRCKSTTIRVNGKANAISIDNCSRLDLIIDSLVSSVEVINVGNFRMQVLGTLPTVQLDKVDVATLFLSKESIDTEVLTSKCSSVNVTLPPASEQDDSVECPVPEQIKSYIKNGQLVSEIVKSEGM